MQNILQGFENTECSMDDILIWANTPEELKRLTLAVIKQLFEHGVRLNKDKCKFQKKQIKFLGHIFSSNGVSIDEERVKAIEKIKTPTCFAELQRFLGMVNYCSKFIPSYSEISEPLRRLLHKDVLWEWSSDQENAFAKLKEALKNAPKLAYYNVNKPVVVSVDASSHSVGAVLQENRPVAYATVALTPAQQRYPQIEKEAFAIRFGCKKFHDYIYGKSVTVETDHKPLEAIGKKRLNSAPPRLQRILFDVLQYLPKIVYKRGTTIPIPDTLSRDCTHDGEDKYGEQELFEVVLDVSLPDLTFPELCKAVNSDEELQHLRSMVLKGWPENINDVPPVIKKYWNFREELAVYQDLLFKRERLMVPKSLQNNYLKLIHQGHLGVNLSLYFAREIVYWHGMTQDIEQYVQRCTVCQQTARSPNTEPLIMKPVPRFPWQRVATDLFAFGGNVFCLVVDSYSGFFDFVKLREPTSEAVIHYMKELFTTHGIPDFIESDNGPQFSSLAFKNFTRSWKIKHITSSPLYPKSNGLAERYVQIAKLILKRCVLDHSDYRLALLNWRNIPRGNLPSPAQRLFEHPTRTLIPLHPKRREPQNFKNVPLQMVREKQRSASTSTFKNSPPALHNGQSVKLKTEPRHWIPARVIRRYEDAPRSYLVTTPDGKVYRRNTGVLRPTAANLPAEQQAVIRLPVGESSPVEQESTPPNSSSVQVDDKPSVNIPVTPAPQIRATRSGRTVRPPNRLNL